MFNFIELQKDNIKKIIKIVTNSDYKKGIPGLVLKKHVLFKALGKTDINTIDFSKLQTYVENNAAVLDDEVVQYYCHFLGAKLSKKYKYHDKLKTIIDDTSYDELSDDQKEKIEELKESYESSPILDDFNEYIKFLCSPSKNTLNKINESKMEETITNLKSEVEELKEKKQELETNYAEQTRQLKAKNNELSQLKKSNENLAKTLSFENVTLKVKSLLPANFNAASYMDVYEQLEKEEQEAILNSNYDQCSKILVAKYAIIKLMKEGK